MYNLPSFTLQGEVEEDVPALLMSHDDTNFGRMGSLYSTNLPLSVAYLASLDKSFELESQVYEGQSSIGRLDRFFLSDSIDLNTSLKEGSTFLEASSLINAVPNGNKSDQITTAESCTSNGRSCCYSISLNTLQVLCFHPALSQFDACPPLNYILLLEDFTNQLYTGVLRCSTCRSKSLHSLVSLCICADLIMEMLGRVIQNSLSYGEGRDDVDNMRFECSARRNQASRGRGISSSERECEGLGPWGSRVPRADSTSLNYFVKSRCVESRSARVLT